MSEIKEVPQVVKERKRPGKIARNVAGVGAAVIAGVSAVGGVEKGGPSIAHAQEATPARATATLPARTPTTSPDVLVIPRSQFNDLIDRGVRIGVEAEKTAIAKQPSPTPITVYRETRTEREVGTGPGQGILIAILGALGGALGTVAGIVRVSGFRDFVGRVIHRFGPRPPAPPAVPNP